MMICLLFHNSAVAYTVALGLFLAVGRETTGKIPPGKVCTYSGSVHTPSENLKTTPPLIKCVPFTLRWRNLKMQRSLITGHFGFVFAENSVRVITSWRHRFRKVPFSWRITVDIGKATFSNFSGLVWRGVSMSWGGSRRKGGHRLSRSSSKCG